MTKFTAPTSPSKARPHARYAAVALLLTLSGGLSATAMAAAAVSAASSATSSGTASAAPTLRAEASAHAQTELRHLLDGQRFRAAAPLMKPLLAKPHPDAAERALIYEWLTVVDDLAEVDRRTKRASTQRDAAVDLTAQGRLALARKDFDAADAAFAKALSQARTPRERSGALLGQGQLAFERRDYDGAATRAQDALNAVETPDALVARADALIRLGRTNEAVDALERAIRINPYHESANYQLGNGYTRTNYTELAARCGDGFQHAVKTTREASDAFERGDIDGSRDAAQRALFACPGYGRAYAVMAKVAEAERLAVDVHRARYEAEFAATPMPEIPEIERYVLNWGSLSERHRKRVALSIAPWKAYVPVLVAGGASHFIKPLYMRLSETPGAGSMRDARIDYDSRLWDDVRGMGGHLTVTGIEDVERSIYGRYNTVLHELSHQVHGVMTAADKREIQELYRRAKERDAKTGRAFLSRYAGGSIWEYFAEGANSQSSPRRDAYDFREIGRERLAGIDPDLQALILRDFARTDVRASLPVSLVNEGLRRFETGDPQAGMSELRRALALAPQDEQVLSANLYGLSLSGDGDAIAALADRAVALHPDSGGLRVAAVSALWHAGRPLGPLAAQLEAARDKVRADDRFEVDMALGNYALQQGEAARAVTAFGRALATQSDSPEALWGRAGALALASRWDEAFGVYGQALKLRTGLVPLRLDLARDLMLAGRTEAALQQLQEIRTLNPKEPQLIALGAWTELAAKRPEAARGRADEALAAGPWCDTALVVRAAALKALGRQKEAEAASAALSRQRAAATPRFVFRRDTASWESVPSQSASALRVSAAVEALAVPR